MTREEFAKAFRPLCVAYDKPADQEKMTVWYNFFMYVDINTFRNACARLIETCRYFPSIAEVKTQIAIMSNPALQTDAESEWDSVQDAMRRFGYYRADEAMASLSPTAQKVIKRMGGFETICTSEEGVWLRKNFCELYKEIQARDLNSARIGESRRLPGEQDRMEALTQKTLALLDTHTDEAPETKEEKEETSGFLKKDKMDWKSIING